MLHTTLQVIRGQLFLTYSTTGNKRSAHQEQLLAVELHTTLQVIRGQLIRSMAASCYHEYWWIFQRDESLSNVGGCGGWGTRLGPETLPVVEVLQAFLQQTRTNSGNVRMSGGVFVV